MYRNEYFKNVTHIIDNTEKNNTLHEISEEDRSMEYIVKFLKDIYKESINKEYHILLQDVKKVIQNRERDLEGNEITPYIEEVTLIIDGGWKEPGAGIHFDYFLENHGVRFNPDGTIIDEDL